MKKSTIAIMNIMALVVWYVGTATQSFAQDGTDHIHHEMQHGFILGSDDQFASHLVATKHHSRQTEIVGQLIIADQQEMAFYQERKTRSDGSSYFLFQAQSLNLPKLTEGQLLIGHIIESKIGDYDPKNKIVKSATFRVDKVLLNIPNPFFME
jgi:hypothetical protein